MSPLRDLYARAMAGNAQAREQLTDALVAIKQRVSRDRLIDFTRYTFPGYHTNWHHTLIASYLDRVERGEIKRLMIFTPPRHGKSELVSRRFPAHYLGRNPDRRVVVASYAADLARSLNRDTQRIIDSDSYHDLFPETRLSGTRVRTDHRGHYLRNADEFEIVGHRGGHKSVGIGGGLTGRGFDLGLIDDPVKGRKEAESKVYRETVWDWYTGVFYSRRQGTDAAIVLVMTRWHEDDLAGRLLAAQGTGEPWADEWVVLWLPALAEGDNPYDVKIEPDPREVGEALWPDLFDRQELLSVAGKDARDWNSIYQQRPAPPEGSLFKLHWLQPYDKLANGRLGLGPTYSCPTSSMIRFLTVDLATSTRTSADFTVAACWGLTPDHQLVLLDLHRERMEGPDLVPMLSGMASRWSAGTVWIEASGFQLSIVQQARRAGLPVRELRPDADKYARSVASTPLLEAGRLWVPRAAPWLASFEAELLSFPNGTHDDQVDALTYACHVTETLSLRPPSPPRASLEDPPTPNHMLRLPGQEEPEDHVWRYRLRGT